MLARLERRRVVRREHVRDARARVPQADRRVGVDALRAQALHLGAAFVEFPLPLRGRCDHAVLGRRRYGRRRVVLLLVSILYGHGKDDPLRCRALVKRRRGHMDVGSSF